MSSTQDTKKERPQWREGEAVMSSCLKQRGKETKRDTWEWDRYIVEDETNVKKGGQAIFAMNF